ncbi:MAG: nuclear transport factor 2 family protein [Candidatus Binatia bacterium]|nr:nuclear transport factor 2 family protein [Candidatus Binatia bacterium]
MAKTAKSATKAAKAKKATPAKRVVAKAVRKPAPKAARKERALVAPLPAASPVVEDYIAIQQLLHKYCHAVDRGTADEVAELFHPDGVLCPRYESDERYEGREAVRGWYARYMENFRTKVRYLRHKITSPVIDITGDEATSVCYLDADSVSLSSNQPSVAFGRYEDKLIKDGGRWWFKERTIIVYYSYSIESYREGRGA